jgi:hypothetical protein
MVDRKTAAQLCSMSIPTYDKWAKQGRLPAMNDAGRVSIEALKRAAWKLDGIRERHDSDDPNVILAAWESDNGRD